MPQDRKVLVYESGKGVTGVRTGSVATAAKREVDKSYSERMADEAAASSAKKKQKDANDALLPSPQVKRALAAATGFGKS